MYTTANIFGLFLKLLVNLAGSLIYKLLELILNRY